MKVMIVFFALLILCVGFITYQTDLNHYMILQKELKFTAEEMARGGALFIKKGATLDKEYCIDVDMANWYAEFIKDYSETRGVFAGGKLDTFVNLKYSKKGVEVTLTYTSDKDLFRLPGIDIRSVSRTTCYAWE